jgi:hypothetical protein
VLTSTVRYFLACLTLDIVTDVDIAIIFDVST